MTEQEALALLSKLTYEEKIRLNYLLIWIEHKRAEDAKGKSMTKGNES